MGSFQGKLNFTVDEETYIRYVLFAAHESAHYENFMGRLLDVYEHHVEAHPPDERVGPSSEEGNEVVVR
jgi:hypothetical protein